MRPEYRGYDMEYSALSKAELIRKVERLERILAGQKRETGGSTGKKRNYIPQLEVFRDTVDSIPYPIFSVDSKYRYTGFNAAHKAAMKALYGTDIAPGMSLLECQTVDADREAARRNLDRALKGETVIKEEYSGHSDLSRRYFEISHTPIRDPGGAITGVSVLARDITVEKHAGDARRRSAEQYRYLFNNMLNGMAYCKMIFEDGAPADFIYLEVNAAFESLTGLKDAAGKKVSQVIPGFRESDPGLFEIYDRVARTGIPEVFEMHVKSLDMWFAISVYSPEREFFVAVFDVITLRKQIEAARERALEALRESEYRYGLLVRSLPGMSLHLFDRDHRFLIADGEEIRKAGFTRESIEGHTLEEAYPPDVARLFAPLYDKALQGESTELEMEFGGMHYRQNVVPVRDSRGRVYAGMVISQNVTELAQAEAQRIAVQEALRDSEERFRRAFEMASIGALLASPDKMFKNINDAFCAMMGYSREELMQKNFLEVTHPDDMAATLECSRALLSGEVRSCRIEKRYIRKDGGLLWADVNAMLFREKDGTPLHFLAYIIDITARKKAEEMLGMTYARLERIASSNVVGVVLGDARGGIHEANDYYLNLLGRTRDELDAGLVRWDEMTPPDHLPSDARALTELRERGICTPYEKEYIRKDGSRVWVLIADALVPGPEERILAIVVDIDDRKRAEARIHEALDEKVMLLKEIHHRVKNNLQVITSLVSLELLGISDAHAIAAFQDIQNRIKAMAILHERLYRSDNVANILLRDYVEEMAENLIRSLAVDHAKISLRCEMGDLRLGLDQAVPLGLILNELITNALKHAFPDGTHGAIVISMTRDGGGTNRLSIRDDGAGMPETVDPETANSLGLRLVRMITQQIHGTLKIVRDGGTEIVIRFKNGEA
ncbi:MAG: PAS domain S-box protein [Spirochaetes bacterium]|nr:MAG: PAS domain S-box protein [Spirochaetota bacterium]